MTHRTAARLQAFHANIAPAENSKTHTPSNSEIPTTNDQMPHEGRLKLEDWSFPGIWILGFGAFIRNQNHPTPVFTSSVDTFSTTTWLISTLLSWFRLPCAMMMQRLGKWCAGSIRLSQKWSARIDRD